MRTQAISIAYVVTAIFGVELWRFYILPGMPLTEFMRLFLIFTAVVAVPVSLYNIWQHYKSKERWVWGRGVGREWVRVYVMYACICASIRSHARTHTILRTFVRLQQVLSRYMYTRLYCVYSNACYASSSTF